MLTSVLSYLFIWAVLDFRLFFHSRRRPFLLDADFINSFLRYVSGPIDYLASLVVQLYYYPWLGALAILSILVTIYAATTAILQSFGRTTRLVSLVPAALGLLLLQQHITVFPLLSFAFSLCMVALLIRCNILPLVFRSTIFIILAIFTCYFAGGTVLLFAIIGALNELLNKKQRAVAIGYIVLGTLIPYLIGSVFFEPDRILQYFIGAPLEKVSLDLHPLEIIWYMLYPVTIIGTLYAKYLRPLYLRILRLSMIVALAFICFAMVNFRFNRYTPMTLDFYAESGEWKKALDYAESFPAQATIMTAHIVNHALYHTGRLPHDMFDYPQFQNSRVLLLGVGDNEPDVFPRAANRRCDVYYHLGRIDQAERWAHEVLTDQGFHGSILRRLISINVLKNRPGAARMYAGVMQKTFTHHHLATELIAQFDKGELLANNTEIDGICPLLPKTDYVGEWTTKELLTQQLREAPTNRMAFEYLMAYLLLEGNLLEFGKNVYRVETNGYRVLPRAYEEACLLYTFSTGHRPPDLDLRVREDTMKKFERFMVLLQKHDRDRRKAWEVLQPGFGNTYWFFKVFGRSGSLPPPTFDGKQ